MKGVILAAGFGTRLGLITQDVPKPLIPIASHRLIDWPVRSLQKAGISDIVVNLHHHGDRIQEYLTTTFPEISFQFSHEEIILGTGGGIAVMKPFFDDTFVIHNADIISDVPIADVIRHHRKTNACATMVTIDRPAAPNTGEVLIDQKGFVRQITGQPSGIAPANARVFAGIHVVEPIIFDYIRPRFSSVITDFYIPLLQSQKQVSAYDHDGCWYDVGHADVYQLVSGAELAAVESLL